LAPVGTDQSHASTNSLFHIHQIAPIVSGSSSGNERATNVGTRPIICSSSSYKANGSFTGVFQSINRSINQVISLFLNNKKATYKGKNITLLTGHQGRKTSSTGAHKYC